MKRKPGRAALTGALAVVLALALTACGGGGDGKGVASLNPTTGQTTTGDEGSGRTGKQDAQDAALDYARCMREHGVDMADPVNGRLELKTKRGDQRKMEEAQKACRHILEDAMPPLSEEQQAEMREAALDFAKCMRDHGVDMPDPTFKDGGMLMRMPEGTKGDDPKVQDAQKACQPILDRARPKGEKDQGGTS
jgi:hypothetical protein